MTNFVVTYGVTNVLPKLVNMLLFCTEKKNFLFFQFLIFRCCQAINMLFHLHLPGRQLHLSERQQVFVFLLTDKKEQGFSSDPVSVPIAMVVVDT